MEKNSIGDACTPQPGEPVFNTKKCRSNETIQRSGDFQSKRCQFLKVQIMFKKKKVTFKRENMYHNNVWPEIWPAQDFTGQGHYSNMSRSLHNIANLHPLTNVATKYQLHTTLQFPRYCQDQILKVK